MKNPRKTFSWIINILKKYNIPFVVTGGLAAKSYGSARELNDIDIDIHDKDLNLIFKEVEPYVVFGPKQYKDERWDLLLLMLNYEGQDIDISGGNTLKICDARSGEWVDSPTDFFGIEERDIFGIRVPVISRKGLIDYKSMLVGENQKIDIKAVKESQ